jgi:hypothetical protein
VAEALRTTFTTQSPASLRQDLESLVRTLKRRLEALETLVSARLVVDSGVTRSGDVALRFGHAVRVAPNDGATVRVRLPKATADDAGKPCSVIRTAATGKVFVYPTGCEVNGQASVQLIAAIKWFPYTFDGQNFYAADYGTVAES